MRTKIILLSLAASLCATFAMAQETTKSKATVIVDVFTVKSSANATYRSVVVNMRDNVIAAMQKTQRINIIDVTTESFFQSRATTASSEEALMSALDGADVREAASKEFEAKFAIYCCPVNQTASHNNPSEMYSKHISDGFFF